MTDGAGDDAVGYRSPPKHRQFKKGVSGNPRGRPRRSRNYRAIMLEEMSEPINVTIDGQRRRLPTFHVLIKRLKADALKGDAKARTELFDRVERHCPELFADEFRQALTETQREVMRRFFERASASETGRRETSDSLKQLLKSRKKPAE